jgi:predicted MFS family arabinose efflux permease
VPALLGVGFGVGLFTAPVVAAALRAVPPERSGLASGINNTARQAGTALGGLLVAARVIQLRRSPTWEVMDRH